MAIQRPQGTGGQGWLGDPAERFQTAAAPTLDSNSTSLGDASILLSMESQLVSLYAERCQLHQALGVSDADDVIAMVEQIRSGSPGGTPTVEDMEGRIGELDRWADELATKAAELDRREHELTGAPEPGGAGDDVRRAIEEHAVEVDRREADLDVREVELRRLAAEVEAQAASIAQRQQLLDGVEEQMPARVAEIEASLAVRDAQLVDRAELLARRAEQVEAQAAELARRATDLDARESVLDERYAEIAELSELLSIRENGLLAQAAQIEARGAELSEREATVAAAEESLRAGSTGDELRRVTPRHVIEQGPLFDKVRGLETHLVTVYETMDKLSELLETPR